MTVIDINIQWQFFLWASAFSLFLFMNRVVGRKERRVWLVDCQN